MKYFIRSVKYLIFVVALFAILVGIMLLTSPKGTTIEALFIPGAMPKILLFFVLIAAIYPMFGYIKKEAFLNKDYTEVKNIIDDVFNAAGYVIASEDSEKVVYQSSKPLTRFMRLYEDYIILNKTDNPIVLEGGRKDVYKLIRAIEFRINKDENS